MYKQVLIALSILFLLSHKVYSQNEKVDIFDYSNPEEYRISAIELEGVKYLDKGVLTHLFGVNVGDTVFVPSDKISKAIQKLWNQGLFSDIKVAAEEVSSGELKLIINLTERPRLSKLVIDGVKRAESEDLMEKLNLRSGIQVTDNVVNNSINIIKKHYHEKGFYLADVQAVKKDDTSAVNNVNLTFYVNKGKKVKINQIAFEGNKVFKERKLKRFMKETKQKRFMRIFKPSKFIEEKYKEDKEKIISKYNEKGYRDARITTDSVYLHGKRTVNIDIALEEGNQYFYRNIVWVGNTKYPDEFLSAILGVEKGDIYDQELLNKRLYVDEDAVSNLYLDDGYLFFHVEPVEVNVANDSVDIEFRMMEGDQAYINKIIIAGNTKTHEHVVRRELRTKPGNLFSRSDIIRSVRELAQLGHFNPETIEPVPIPDAASGTVDIKYNLEEKANDQLEISGGWGAGMLVGTVGLRFSNFSIRNIFNLKEYKPVPSGDGQTLSLRAQTNGNYYKSFNVSFVEPWFGGKKPNSFSVSFYRSVRDYYGQADEVTGVMTDPYMKVTGIGVGLGRRLKWPDDFFTLFNEVNWQGYNLRDYGGFLFENGRANNLSLKTVLSRNNTDQIIYPRRGASISLGLQFTPPYSLFSGKDYSNVEDNEKYEWIEYHKWTFKGTWYYELVKKLVLSVNTQFGYLGYYNQDIGPSPFEGFDVGGDGMSGYSFYGRDVIALRGYDNGSLTPTIVRSNNVVKSGNVYTKYTMELRYPITLSPSASIYVLSFLEGGNCWYNMDEFNPFEFKRSAGIGMRAFLPMLGMIGIDWGYGFDPAPGERKAHGSEIHFILGQQF